MVLKQRWATDERHADTQGEMLRYLRMWLASRRNRGGLRVVEEMFG